MFFVSNGNVIKQYAISSSMHGTGSKAGSLKTPLGKHRIVAKIGKDLPYGAILKARKWTKKIAEIIREPIDIELDVITTRILWLEGLEKGLNKGKNIDSKARCIYIHGTAEEGLIGKPASNGCIRMYNRDVIELFEQVEIGTQVWID